MLPLRDGGEGMGDIINLKRFKKRSERAEAASQADANRARFGRTKAERARDELHETRADKHLEQHRIDGEDPS